MKPGIKKITDQVPILGHIKIGGRKKLETKDGAGRNKIIPVKYDHFVVTTTNQSELGYIPDDELAKKLYADQMGLLIAEHTEPIYDENGHLIKTIETETREHLIEENKRLTRIIVSLPFDSIDENLVTSLAVYDNAGCRCRGNNEEAEYVDPKTGEIKHIKCPCNLLLARLSPDDDIDKRQPHGAGLKPEPGKGLMCKANGILRMFLKQARTFSGVHVFRTTSVNSIRQLMFAMRQIYNLTGGYIAGIPMVLELQTKMVSPGPNKKLQKAYVVTLTRRASQNEFLRHVLENAALLENVRKQLATKDFAQLPAPGRENPYDAYAIKEEYYNPDGSVETEIDGEVVSDFIDGDHAPALEAHQEQPESKPEPDPENPAQTAQAETAQPMAGTQDEPPSKAPETSQEPSKPEEPQGQAATTNEAPTKAPPQEQPENDTAPPDADMITFGRFKPVDTRKPDKADESPASKDTRRAFFAKLKEADYSDDEIRGWLETLWKVQSSSSLKSWQVTAMLNALA